MSQITFTSIIPLIPALDMEKSISFYVNHLGFSNHIQDGDPLTYAGLKKDEIEFHLYKTENTVLGEWTVIRLQTNQIEELFAQYEGQDFMHPNAKLTLKPYGLKEFSLIDPGGVCVTFFQRV